MVKPPKDKDQEKGDEVLRRLLKTPPDHRTGKKSREPVAKDKRDAPKNRQRTA